MKLKKVTPLLLSFAFLMTGCIEGEKTSNKNQKTSKESLISAEFFSNNLRNSEEILYKYASKTIVEESIESAYTRQSNLTQYGFIEYRDSTDSSFHYYSIHKRGFADAVTNSSSNYRSFSSSYVGGYLGIYDSASSRYRVYNGLGQHIVDTTGTPSSLRDNYNKKTGVITLSYSESPSYDTKTIQYNPDSGSISPSSYSSTIGDYKGNVDLQDYGHTGMSLYFLERKVDIFSGDSNVGSYDLPYAGSEAKILGDNLVFLVEYTLPDTIKDFQYINPDYENMKLKQEIYLLNYMTGKRTIVKSDYYIDKLQPLFDSSGNKTVASADFYEIRSDKTINPNPRKYLIDSDFVIHDDITNIDIDGAKAVTTSEGTFIVNPNGKVYDSDLNVYKDFSNDLSSFTFSSSGLHVIGKRNGKYGVANIHGKVVVSFDYDTIYLDPDYSSLLFAKKGDSYYTLRKSGSSFSQNSTEITTITASDQGCLTYSPNGYELYSNSGSVIQSFGNEITLTGGGTLTLSAVKTSHSVVTYNEEGHAKTLLIKFTA